MTAGKGKASGIYLLEGELDATEVARIGWEILADDPIAEDFSCGEGSLSRIEGEDVNVTEVACNLGVTDHVAGSVGVVEWIIWPVSVTLQVQFSL